MRTEFQTNAIWSVLCLVLSACGGGSNDEPAVNINLPVNIDYAAISIAESQDAPLVSADEQTLLALLRNGVRLSLRNGPVDGIGVFNSAAAPLPPTSTFSDTTVQVDGVDEGDAVKYDGRHIYAIRAEPMPTSGPQPRPGVVGLSVYWPSLQSSLKIVRANAVTATTQQVGEFRLAGRQSTVPFIYQLKDAVQATSHIAAVSQVDFSELSMQSTTPLPRATRVSVALLDVRDPLNVNQAWKLEVEGTLRASRQIGDTLYLVSSHWPQLPTLNTQATTNAERQANERLVLRTTINDLLPHYWQNDGAAQVLARPGDCLVPSVGAHDAYRELVFITAINLRDRRIADVACASAGANGIYMSRNSLYLGGDSYRGGLVFAPNSQTTVLHKFALTGGALEYRASGAVAGTVGWSNSSYFMDEYQGNLRILTTRYATSGAPSHHLNVLGENSGKLSLLATLPNAAHPAPIGKPWEQVRAVRFADERAFVVTFLLTDPLYVIDLSRPADPVLAGELNVPGFSTYLKPLGKNYLLGVGLLGDRVLGVKVELFDVRDLACPKTVGSRVFGHAWSEAIGDFHALTFLPIPGTQTRYRMALPLIVIDTLSPSSANINNWTYGLHLFEFSGLDSDTPQFHFQGVLKAEEAGQTQSPRYPDVNRSVLHDDSVFYVFGDTIISSLWQNIR